MNNQPIMNIGLLGSVSDGKSTAVYQLTKTRTQRHSNEKKRNITIKPGYANFKIFKDEKLIHHLSFIDCPGHHELILTMLSSVDLMSGVIVVISLAEDINNKPQLIQHLAAIKLAGIEKVIVCLNKLDLIDKFTAMKQKEIVDKLLDKYDIKPKYIIPCCFSRNLGIDYLKDAIMDTFNPKDINYSDDKMIFKTSRSFDVNKPGISYDKVVGGVLGGSLISGKLNVGDEIEIRPGIIGQKNNKLSCIPINAIVQSIKSEKNNYENINPGGLMAIGTHIDPYYCKNDNLAGNVIGFKGHLPSVYDEITINFNYTDDFGYYDKIKNQEIVNLQIGTISIESRTINVKKKNITFKLSRPACIDDEQIILASVKTDKFYIIGYGNLIRGNKILV